MDTDAILGQIYRPRVIDAPLGRALQAAGAVVIEGARATGKTMTALHAAESFAFMDDDTTQQLLSIAPETVLEGARPRLLDEWQVTPGLWNLVRRAVDASTDLGQFILTGSAIPADDVTRHTGAGRFLRLRQHTMTWWEKLGSPGGGVSLAGLFDGERPVASTGGAPTIEDLVDQLLVPGFPAMTQLDHRQSAARLRAYIDDVSRTDVHRLATIRHEPAVIVQLIRSLARSVATDVTHRSLAADVRTVAPAIDPETIGTYLGLLQRLFIVETQPSWTPRLRSRARVRVAPKLHLADPALAAAALGADATRLMREPQTIGTLFESAVVHDLTVFAAALDGNVAHFRDSYGKEIDAIVTLPDGRWGTVEVKLGAGQAAAAVASLDDVIRTIDTDSTGVPAFRLVVVGTGPTLTTGDGTVVAPLSALAP